MNGLKEKNKFMNLMLNKT